MIFALIKNNIIKNIIVADEAFIALIENEYDDILELQDAPGQPGIGWDNSSGEFIPPIAEPPTPEMKQNLEAAFGSDLVKQLNIFYETAKLTADEKYKFIQIISPLNSLLQLGDLQSALDIIPAIPVDGTLITQDLMDSFYKQIVVYLEQ